MNNCVLLLQFWAVGLKHHSFLGHTLMLVKDNVTSYYNDNADVIVMGDDV